MTVALLTDLGEILTDANLVTDPDLYLGRMPEDVDSGVQVRDYGGRPVTTTHTGFSYRYPRVQIVVRDPDPVVARQLAEDIYALLLSTQGWDDDDLTINGTTYQVIVPLAELVLLSHDEHERTNISCNYEVRVPHV